MSRSTTLKIEHVKQNRRLQFSLRSMLAVTTGVAMFVGYWRLLDTVSPRWRGLIARVDAARAMIDPRESLHEKSEAFESWYSSQTYFDGILALLTFYGVKLAITRCNLPNDIKALAYLLLVCVMLTYIYLYWSDWGSRQIFLIGNWLFVPVTVLTIPTITFLSDLRRPPPDDAVSVAVERSALELVVAMPIWYFVWGVVSLMLGLWWI